MLSARPNSALQIPLQYTAEFNTYIPKTFCHVSKPLAVAPSFLFGTEKLHFTTLLSLWTGAEAAFPRERDATLISQAHTITQPDKIRNQQLF